MAHLRESRPDRGLGFQVQVLKTLLRCSLLTQKQSAVFKRGVADKCRCLPSKVLEVNTMLERGPESPRRLPSISVPPRLHLPASVSLETCVMLRTVGLRVPLVWGLGVGVYGARFWVSGSGFRV